MGELTYNIFDVLDKIRKRPGMYTGEVSLASLNTFLCGYQMAMDGVGAVDIASPGFGGFFEWAARKHGCRPSSFGWGNLVLAISVGDNPHEVKWEGYAESISFEQHKESVELFYKLLDEYRSNQDV
ncbi:hypothetical protein [Hahella ganghwensis]|uniref:hypothetical protein n=1 Tax=Hahella ganghwensis TaxID=286420 RepID=UPI00038157C1|nr:hypothetical protein [Hahella ganghwensis]